MRTPASEACKRTGAADEYDEFAGDSLQNDWEVDRTTADADGEDERSRSPPASSRTGGRQADRRGNADQEVDRVGGLAGGCGPGSCQGDEHVESSCVELSGNVPPLRGVAGLGAAEATSTLSRVVSKCLETCPPLRGAAGMGAARATCTLSRVVWKRAPLARGLRAWDPRTRRAVRRAGCQPRSRRRGSMMCAIRSRMSVRRGRVLDLPPRGVDQRRAPLPETDRGEAESS